MRKALWFYFLCVCLPLMVLVAGGIRLVCLEARDARLAEEAGLELRAERLAENIELHLRKAGEAWLTELKDKCGDGDRAIGALDEIEEREPFVRSVFVWRDGEKAKGPVVVRTASEGQMAESRRRLSPWLRPDAKWDGDIGWKVGSDGTERVLLGWVRTSDGAVCGFEVEQLAVLSRMEGWLNAELEKEAKDGKPRLVAAITDSNGVTVIPGAELLKGRLSVYVPMKEMFPQWCVCVAYASGEKMAAGGMFHKSLLIAILLFLLVGVFAGGTWILFKAARQSEWEKRQQGTFISMMSHELKTPLSVIMLYVEILRDRESALGEEAGKCVDTIEANAKHLLSLIEGLLSYSRLDKGGFVFKLSAFGLEDCVREMIGRPRLSYEGLQMRLEVGNDLPEIKADRSMVEVVVENLLSNAKKYAGDGVPVEISVKRHGGYVRLSVRDHGPGLSARDCRHVFERFWRADRSLTNSIPGCGVGLSLVKGLVEGMGGRVAVYSEPGKGSEFVCDFRR